MQTLVKWPRWGFNLSKRVRIAAFCLMLIILVFGKVSHGIANDLIRLSLYDADHDQWHDILAELAVTADQHQIGLMHRQYLADNHGMLFIYEQEKPLSFWMKNTYISLDIIYFTSDGIWINTAHNTTPLSLIPYPSLAPAQFVLELPAGQAKRLNIGAGSQFIVKDCNMLKSGLDFVPCTR